MTQGLRSSECWIAMLAILCGTVLILCDRIEPGTMLIASATAGYAVSRGLAKGKSE